MRHNLYITVKILDYWIETDIIKGYFAYALLIIGNKMYLAEKKL